MLSFKEIGNLDSMLKKVQQDLDYAVSKKVYGAAMLMQKELHDRTPVWSGLAAANHQWTFDTPFQGMVTIEHTGSKGTNSLPLGSEPNRSRARAASDASLQALNFYKNPYRTVYVTNNTVYPGPHGLTFADLEYGFLPGGPGQQSRTPASGIYRGAAQVVQERAK